MSNPLIGSKVQYPTPWRAAEERNGHIVVVCDEGHYVAECPNGDVAELIVASVNACAESGRTS